MSRVLVIDDEAKAKVAQVVEYANQPGKIYNPFDPAHVIPSTDENHVVFLNTFRCVFSITKADSEVYRHLSISVPGEDYPNPHAVFEICKLFGFTGNSLFPTTWTLKVNKDEHCIVIVERLP